MYEEQVLSYLQSINNKANSLDNNVLNTKVSNDRILYQLQELNSGDKILQNQINELKTQNTTIMCILMLAILFYFIVRSFK